MAVCSKCGQEVSETSVVCQNCGNVLKNPFDEINKKFVQTGAHIPTDDEIKSQPTQAVMQQPQLQSVQAVEQQPVEQLQVQQPPVEQTTTAVPVESDVNPIIKYGTLGLFMIDIIFFIVRALLSTKGSIIYIIVVGLCMTFLIILGYNKYKNMQASFKDGYIRLFTIILILNLIMALFNPLGFIRSILSISWWLGTIIACFGLFVGYYITKKLDIIIITSKLESDSIIDFIIVDLGIVLPIIALLLKIRVY